MEKVSLTFRKNSGNSKDNADDALSCRQNVSFKFSKQTAKKLSSGNTLSDENHPENAEKELILSVEGKEIKSSVPKEEKKKLVIPSIQRNLWRNPHLKSQREKRGNKSEASDNLISELAVKELLKESAIENERWEKREFQNYTVTIPVVIQNKVPDEFETADNLNTELRAEESTLEDYDRVQVGEFAAALFRGLGCNPGDPIGNRNKKSIKPVEAVQRSKGLGLGADKKPSKNSVTQHSKPNEELKLAAGAYVHVVQGYHQDSYGQVEGLDESRAVVKLSRQNKNISVPMLYVEVISKKEFQKESKVLNKSSYEKYKKEQKMKHDQDLEAEPSEILHEQKDHGSDERKENEHRSTVRKADCLQDDDAASKHHKRRKHNRKKEEKQDENNRESYSWVCPQLRVRFIDSEFKSGKYYKEKMTVVDVLSPQSCVCRTENGRYLEGILPSMLETVIPRSEPSFVMVVEGKYKGQLCIVLKRNKSRCTATVQFLSDREKVVKLGYDSICEYTGDVSQFD